MVTCYEAGAFGFHLHCRLEKLGIKNYVVQRQDWDERGQGVKNDRLDAAALCQRLDRFERGWREIACPWNCLELSLTSPTLTAWSNGVSAMRTLGTFSTPEGMRISDPARLPPKAVPQNQGMYTGRSPLCCTKENASENSRF